MCISFSEGIQVNLGAENTPYCLIDSIQRYLGAIWREAYSSSESVRSTLQKKIYILRLIPYFYNKNTMFGKGIILNLQFYFQPLIGGCLNTHSFFWEFWDCDICGMTCIQASVSQSLREHASVPLDNRHCCQWLSSLFCGFLPNPLSMTCSSHKFVDGFVSIVFDVSSELATILVVKKKDDRNKKTSHLIL